MVTLTSIIQENAAYSSNSGVCVEVNTSMQWVSITDMTGSNGAIFMQGDEAGEFIDEIDSLYDQLQTIDKDTIALALARDYIENLWD